MSPDLVLYGIVWPLLICCLLPLLPSPDRLPSAPVGRERRSDGESHTERSRRAAA